MGTNHYKAQAFIDAMPGSAGIISTIAKRVGCAWHTAKKYIDTYPTVKCAYDDECERVLDIAESVVLGDMYNGEVQTAKWYLGMKGDSRGYKQKRQIEHSGPDGKPIVHKIIRVLEYNEDE